MNNKLLNFAKNELKIGLAQCTEDQQMIFKRMYAYEYKYDENNHSYIPNGNKPDLNKDINEVIDKMPEDKLDWAMQQIENTLAKNKITETKINNT